MNNTTKIGSIVGIVFLMLIFVWLFSENRESGDAERETYVSANWTQRFQPFDKKPLGLYLFNALVSAHIDK
ncbi:MAG: hypothetical protein JKY09_02795, partial [Crocinitomicaceae bacterium]|nr:hypothetical protein [Crocinitomicaceae bacterium]